MSPLIRPIRLNKQRILWQKLRPTLTVTDPDYRESVGHKEFDPEIALFGQINIFDGRYQMMTRMKTGDKNAIIGRVNFAKKDLDAAGYVIAKGDKFTKFGALGYEQTLNVRVVMVRTLAHQLEASDHILIEVSFTDNYDETESIR